MTTIGVILAVIIGALIGAAILVLAIERALKESDVAEAREFLEWFLGQDLRWREAVKAYERENDVKLKMAAIDIVIKELDL